MNTEATIGSAGIALDRALESLELIGPQLVEELADRFEALGTEGVQTSLTRRPHGNQARVLEHLEVLGDGLLGDVEMRRDFVDRVRLVTHQPQDRAATRLCERSQCSLSRHPAQDINPQLVQAIACRIPVPICPP